MNKNLLKKISMVVASLALIIPLASVNGAAVSAHRTHRHARVVRVIKRHRRRAHKRDTKRIKHMRVGATVSYNDKVNAALNKDPKNRAYNAGFNDALNAKVNHKLVRNQSYEKGYVQVIALDNYTDPTGKRIPRHLSRGAVKGATAYYRYCVLK